jgi:redox-sensitive bicupin YhaK (pirin superfamily)
MIDLRIKPRARDLGDGFTVRRALPDAKRRAVGPFVFFDQMGPVRLEAGHGLDVRPHPHIGLATVTYLFEGEILHRDSLGSVQAIRPGEVNWMTAGRGIVHSERTAPELRAAGPALSGVQTWVALPREEEECEPSFSHHAALPQWEDGGVTLRVILGDVLGLSSPVPTLSPIVYADIELQATRRFAVPSKHEERGLYVIEGDIAIGSQQAAAGEMLVLTPGSEVVVEASTPARVLLFGGAALDGPRHVWWNFVSSRSDRIVEAARDWKDGRFPAVPGETEFIPLPELPGRPVRYP